MIREMDAQTGTNAKNQVGFELRDIRGRRLDDAVWIPLRAGQTITEQGTFGYVGYQREFFGLGSLAISVEQSAAAERLKIAVQSRDRYDLKGFEMVLRIGTRQLSY